METPKHLLNNIIDPWTVHVPRVRVTGARFIGEYYSLTGRLGVIGINGLFFATPVSKQSC